jgi:hypothetical protein
MSRTFFVGGRSGRREGREDAFPFIYSLFIRSRDRRRRASLTLPEAARLNLFPVDYMTQ